MKKIIISTFLIMLILDCNAQKFEFLNRGFTAWDMDFLNENVGWIAGDGKLLKTEDGGLTWKSYHVDNNWSFVKIDFINEFVGWAVIEISDSTLRIQKTEDGGQSWTVQGDDYHWTYNDKVALQAVNDTVVYMSLQSNFLMEHLIFKTTDGGVTWQRISPFSDDRRVNSIWFQDNENGVLIGTEFNSYHVPDNSFILRTEDGGRTWQYRTTTEFSEIYDLQVVNNSTAYFLGRLELGNGSFSLLKTSDFFNSWDSVYHQPNFKINSFYYLDDTHFYMNLTDSRWTAKLMESHDGGGTWQEMQNHGWVSNGDGGSKIHFLNENDGITLIREFYLSLVLQTQDGGKNWTYRNFSDNLNDVKFLDRFTGYICGGGDLVFGIRRGLLSKTTDGIDFQIKYDGDFINKCYFIDKMIGFLLLDTYDGPDLLYKTDNGGTNWKEVFIGNADTDWSYGSDFYFLNRKDGWVVGSGIYATDNYGENWDFVQAYHGTNNNPLSLYSVHGCDTTVWAVGEQGLMVRFTPQNQWQQHPSITDLPLNDVFFSDENHGWIAGGYLTEGHEPHKDFQSIILKTTNGGKIWNTLHLDNYIIKDIYFADSLHGWAVGCDTTFNHHPRYYYGGIILETFDGAETWNTIVENLPGSLNAINFKDDVGWAVGDNGLILRTDNWTTWIDQNTGQAYFLEYKLSQNYPNPFNPKTTIEFSLPKSEFTILKIYNILGKEIRTIVSKKLNSGNHIYTFDGKNLASGVYYYRIEAGNFVQTRKMIYLK
jgi:photosystem II stability/assembly factor-like uncharacterized protein